MTRFRRIAPLVATVGLVAALGAVGLVTSARANDKAQSIHLHDRVTLETTLAGLANQYFQFTIKEAYDFASAQPWRLRAGDPADAAALQRFVTRSALLQHGAALVGLNGQPLSMWSESPGLPPANDPGYAPLRMGLLRREPGFSSVMTVDGAPVVAVAVPVMAGATPKAIFVAFFRADRSPLQTYNARLHHGRTGNSYLLDGSGGVISSSDVTMLGKKFPSAAVLTASVSGRARDLRYTRTGHRFITAIAPVGVGGWTSVIEQQESEFFGPIRSGGLRVLLAVLALLVAAAAIVAFSNQRRESALRHAYEYKGQLLANTTHELKTPLTAIRGAAMTLGTRWRDMRPEQVDTFLGIVHRRCDGLGKLIERILMGARLEAGREVPIEPEPTNILGTLRRTAAEFEDATARHRIVVEAPEDAWCTADADAIDQVLGLLVENAIKYSPEGGDIELVARPIEDGVVVSVTDHGIGMARDVLPHIFEPYFKAHRGATASFAGVGLGLSIAEHLVRRHGGRLEASSVPGEGSTFTFTLAKAEPPHVQEFTLMGVGR